MTTLRQRIRRAVLGPLADPQPAPRCPSCAEAGPVLRQHSPILGEAVHVIAGTREHVGILVAWDGPVGGAATIAVVDPAGAWEAHRHVERGAFHLPTECQSAGGAAPAVSPSSDELARAVRAIRDRHTPPPPPRRSLLDRLGL